MGNFICATVILCLIIIFTVINSITVCDICDDMTDLLDAEKVEEAGKLWRESRAYISLFVRDAEIDVVTAEVERTEEMIPFEDGEAESAIMTLKEAIKELKNTEQFSWQNIL